MTDAHTRAHRRAAAAGDPQAGARALAAELRAGEIKFDLERARELYACRDPKPYTTVREVACPCGVKSCAWCTRREALGPTSHCEKHYRCHCGTSGQVPYDPRDLLRLRAYLGDEAARVLVPTLTDRGLVSAASGPLPDWLAGIERLASRLPPTRVEVDCDKCRGHLQDLLASDDHTTRSTAYAIASNCVCKGTRKRTHDTPAEHYLLVVAAPAAAREVLEFEFGPSIQDPPGRLVRALDACAEWIACPCPTHQGAWLRKEVMMDEPPPEWVPHPLDEPAARIQAAAKILGDDRTRKLAAQAVLEVLR